MITTLAQFIQQCEGSTNYEIYKLFEFNCSDAVKTDVYMWADLKSSEPFRSAMYNLGFTNL